MVGHGVPYLSRHVGRVAASANLLPQATVVAVESGAQVRLQNVAVEHKGGGVEYLDLKPEGFQIEHCVDGHAVPPRDGSVASPARDFVVKLLVVVLGSADIGLSTSASGLVV